MGDVTSDGTYTYAYDAEGRPTSMGGIQVTYDAFGRAVEQNNSGSYTQLVYSPSGNLFATLTGSTVQKYFVPLAAGLTAVYNGSGLEYYRHSDWLGTNRFAGTPSGTVYFDGAYAPFAENYAGIGTSDRVFTGQPMNTLSHVYDFPFREYSQDEGRWLVPDPAGLAAVDLTNPQTWNRYAYVMNNPLSNVDPLGLYLDDCGEDGAGSSWCWGPGDFPIFVPVCPDGCGGGGGGGGHHGGGGGGGGQQPPPQQPINFPNETNGLPNGFPTNPWGIWGAIIPTANCGDLGPCPTIGNGFRAAVATLGGTIICQIAEPCGAIQDILIAGGLVVDAGLLGYLYYSKGGKQNIPPSWVTDRPSPGETADQFARRVCKGHYGSVAGCGSGPGSDFNKIRKWAQDWINKHG